jgi:hypothetical protein
VIARRDVAMKSGKFTADGVSDDGLLRCKCPLLTQSGHHRALDDRAMTLSPNTVVASAGQRL